MSAGAHLKMLIITRGMLASTPSKLWAHQRISEFQQYPAKKLK